MSSACCKFGSRLQPPGYRLYRLRARKPKLEAPMRALTREISPAILQCELTHIPRAPIDLARARAQHAAYERALAAMGCSVERLAAGADMPDSVFIEDTAVVLPEVAIITRPGAES